MISIYQMKIISMLKKFGMYLNVRIWVNIMIYILEAMYFCWQMFLNHSEGHAYNTTN